MSERRLRQMIIIRAIKQRPKTIVLCRLMKHDHEITFVI